MNIFANTWIDAWQVLLIPVLVLIITQFIKVSLEARGPAKFNWRRMNSYGGMPSTHTAFFTATTLVLGLTQGWSSPIFFLSFVVAVTVIRDAVGIRYQLGFHGKVINHLIDTLPEKMQKEFPAHLEDRLGHTRKEALAGFILGTLLTLAFYWLV